MTDFVILNHGQVTRTTPELASLPHPPNFHAIPMGGSLSFDRFIMHRLPTRCTFSGIGLELMTLRPRVRYLDH
ncbi:hypothetical protein TNCV_2504751 [Trichonephila clavipes]|uniref:Uncharacterized protein n=1 Tax=Trichonephila clavipes TaxID=2585209 RepID=A0A8X7BKX8_TRICX|nr:hypothetical protein TNCV_2504751 [Trichonephila clavipes]